MDSLESFVRAQAQDVTGTPAAVVTEQPAATEAPVVTPATPTETPAAAPVTPPVATDTLIDLDTPETPAASSTPEFDFSTLVKDLGIEAKTKEEFVAKYKEAISKEDPLKGLPDNLKKAVDFAKQGGDFLQMLKISQIDYSQIDPITIYENNVYQQIKDREKAKEYLESLSHLAKEIEGQKLKNQYIQWQESQERIMKQELEAKASQELTKKLENERRLRDTVNKVDNIEGFRIKPAEKEQFVREVVDGTLSKELFFNERGEYDYEKMMKVRFLAKNFDAIKKHFSKQVETATKRAVIEPLTNAELQTGSQIPTAQKQEFSNPLDAWIAASEKGKK